MSQQAGPIGIFDSGYGGLTVFTEIVKQLPQYDYIYLGDNARVPYGTRSFETVYQYTLECVQHLFDKGCRLVILACNTASAKALRTIQQCDLSRFAGRKVLGVIRPTTEIIGNYTQSREIGIFATQGTVNSDSYLLEIQKFFPDVKVYQEACPMWVSLVENNEHDSDGADFFIKKHIDNLLTRSASIDTIVLACTHYPLLADRISRFLPPHIRLLAQGEIVARSLRDYLQRHPEVEQCCLKGGHSAYYTTDSPEAFDSKAELFTGKAIKSAYLAL